MTQCRATHCRQARVPTLRYIRVARVIPAALLAITLQVPAHAAEPYGPSPSTAPVIPADLVGDDGAELLLENSLMVVREGSMLPPGQEPELLLFEDIQVVVSAARREQPLNLSSVPISVVTKRDIHYSGLTRVEEVLQFVPGMDVLQIDRNRWAVGVRGLHDYTSDRTLTLVNGRNANSPLFGGSEFYRLPIFLEDIERIEVVRGPGGAAWGANAFNGVINIIQKSPKDVQGVLLSSTVNEFGDTYSQARWGHQIEDWAWRLSIGYQDVEPSEDAIDGDRFSSEDFHRTWRFDGAAVHDLSPDTELSFGLGYSSIHQGGFEFLAFAPEADGRVETLRSYVRLDHELPDDATAYLQWFMNYGFTNQPAITRYWTLENDLEGQINFSVGDDHHLSIGGNVRLVHIDSDPKGDQDLRFGDNTFNEQWLGLFVLDRWDVNDRLALELQARGDWYSGTGADWSGRITSLIALDEQKHHILRLGGAKAFRAPLRAIRGLETRRFPFPSPPFPPDAFGTNMVPADGVDNEQVFSFEAGYHATLTEELTVRVDAYWQRYNRLIGARTFPDPMGLGRTFFQLDNLTSAEAFGVEAEVSVGNDHGQLSLWYAFNAFEIDESDSSVRAFLPARHKAGLTGRLFLPEDLVINVNYKYSTTTERSAEVDRPVPAFHALDVAVSKKVFDGRGEFMIGVTDVLDQTDITVVGVGSISGHDTPGRTAFARLQLNF